VSDHRVEASGDEPVGFVDDSPDQFCDGGDVMDEAHRRADRPDARLDVTVLEHLASARSGDEVADVLELTPSVEDFPTSRDTRLLATREVFRKGRKINSVWFSLPATIASLTR
jgi:hypothetical protein